MKQEELKIQRPIDHFGRIVLPRAWREALSMEEGCLLEIMLEEDSIILKKACNE